MDEDSHSVGSAGRESDPLADLLAQGLPSQRENSPDGRPAEATPEDASRTPADGEASPDDWVVRIPGYEVEREIGRGGMGCVYLATQFSTRRRVAIKVMAQGPLVGGLARRRFTHEVEILAQLNHPNIVTIHDSGAVAGLSYYVMDYIPGVRLDDWLAGERRDIGTCLRLFVQICAAVSVAHLRGVMHRDLKPANILVDGEGRPHVLDFGLAKLTADEPAHGQPSTMTLTGQFMGTLPWASPEQAEAVPERIDLRTDVYTLGVILYQMLTGAFPYQVTGAMHDVLQRIINADPIRPSYLNGRIDNEIETIILKCLEKDPGRRYQSAGELARDIERYLAGEAIEAKRQSLRYMLFKQLRRHRLVISIAAIFLLVVSVGFVTSRVFWRRAAAQAKQTEAQRQRLHDETCLRRVAQAQHAQSVRQFGWMRQLLFSCPVSLRGWEWRYLVGQADQSVRDYYGHTDWCKQAVFSTDGKQIATVGYDGRLVLWDQPSGKVLWHTHDPDVQFDHAAFSPGGVWLAATGVDTKLRTQELVGTWNLDSRQHRCMASSGAYGDGTIEFLAERTFAVATGDGIELWNVADATPLKLIADVQPVGHLECLAVSHDRRRICATGPLGEPDSASAIRMWRIDARDPCVWTAIEPEVGVTHALHADRIEALAFSPDDRAIAACTIHGSLLLLDAATAKPLHESLPVVNGQARAVAWSCDGRRLAIAGDDQVVRVFDADRLEQPRNALVGHYAPVTSLAFHPTDPTTLVSCGDDGAAKLWRVTVPQNPIQLRMEGTRAVDFAFSSDGRQLALGGRLGEVELWTPDGGQWQRTTRFQDALGRRLLGVVFDPDSRWIATAGRRHPTDPYDRATVYVWDVCTGEVLLRIAADSERTTALAFSPDAHWLATVGTDRRVKLWDVCATAARDLDGASMVFESGADDQLLSVAFRPDGRGLAWSSDGENAAAWYVPLDTHGSGARPRRVATGHEHGIVAIALLRPGNLLVSGSNDTTVRLSDVNTGRLVRVFHRGQHSILDVAVSPDGRRMAAGAWDHTVRVWDLATGVQVAIFDGPFRGAQRVAFSPRGDRLACLDGEGTLWVWQAPTMTNLRRSAAIGVLLAETAAEMMSRGQQDDARDVFAEAASIIENTLQPNNPRWLRAIDRYTAACEEAGQSNQARRWRRFLDDHADIPWGP